jgi:hypothetical protein
MQQRRLTKKEVNEMFIYFGVDGASFVSGCDIGVMSQLRDKHVPYMMGQHSMAHMTNLIVQLLSNLPMVTKLEDFFTRILFNFS